MLLSIEKVLILKGVEMFAEAPGDELARLVPIVREEEVAAGQTIFRQGDTGSAMYIVVSGRVRVDAGGHTVRTLGEREPFGELAALDPEPRSASVTATEDTLLLRIDREPLLELLGSQPTIMRSVLRTVCRRLRSQA